METILIILGFILFILISKTTIFEKFIDCNIKNLFIINKYNEFPWWNSTRRTRNMSYDLRGDPLIIPKEEYIWHNTIY